MAKLVELVVLGAVLVTALSCGTGELPIAGRVLVDGAPMDSGTLRLDPVGGEPKKGAGGMVERGVLQLPAGHGLTPGTYRVSASAFKKTGKTINDYQRGAVEEMVAVPLRDSPKEVELTSDTADDMTIEFNSAVTR